MNSLNLKIPLEEWTSNHNTYRHWNAYQDQNTIYSWVNDNSNWKKIGLYGTCLLKSCQRVTEIRYNTITPVQIDTTSSDTFVSYSACFTPLKIPKVYGPIFF